MKAAELAGVGFIIIPMFLVLGTLFTREIGDLYYQLGGWALIMCGTILYVIIISIYEEERVELIMLNEKLTQKQFKKIKREVKKK